MFAFLQPSELIYVGLVLLVFFGGSQIPKLARSLGQAQNEFKKGLDEGASSSTEGEEVQES